MALRIMMIFSVEFKSAENLQELEALKGSKYVQSNANDVYKKCKKKVYYKKKEYYLEVALVR